jgi:pimeloyl-ACP methyl ester carboxylesterase
VAGEIPAAPPVVPDGAVQDLHDRLARFRQIPTTTGRGLEGTDPAWIARLVRAWGGAYDWRRHEERIRGLPWRVVQTSRGPLRALHHRVPGAPTVVLLHGWPDSVLRFERLMPLLRDLDVVVPALPGFPFAAPVPSGGMSAAEAGALLAEALAELAPDGAVLSAGDVGTDVAEGVLLHDRSRVTALHFSDVSQYHFLQGLPEDLTDEERAYVERGRRWQAAEGAYMHEQSTRPLTLAVGLGDSPAGLLAWIGEKLDRWSDHGDDLGSVFSDEDLLTWVSAYWFTAAIGTAITPYAVPSAKPVGRVDIPTVFTVFPRDLVNAPRSFAERLFDVRGWTEHGRGGHFAAWEQPESYAQGVREAVAVRLR